MSKYNSGKIYKIVDNTNGSVYIGSTIQTLTRRLTEHERNHHLQEINKGNKTTSIKIIENGFYSIVLLKKFPCNSKQELLMEERKFMDAIECVNQIRPYRSPIEKKEQATSRT